MSSASVCKMCVQDLSEIILHTLKCSIYNTFQARKTDVCRMCARSQKILYTLKCLKYNSFLVMCACVQDKSPPSYGFFYCTNSQRGRTNQRGNNRRVHVYIYKELSVYPAHTLHTWRKALYNQCFKCVQDRCFILHTSCTHLVLEGEKRNDILYLSVYRISCTHILHTLTSEC